MSGQDATTPSAQYLTFTLDGEVYALAIARVREVLELTNITRIPRTPEFLRGVINLRGNPAPVADMRRKLRLPPGQATVNTCIIIAEVQLAGETVIMGALVDGVREVVDIEAGAMVPPPRMGTGVDAAFISGMARLGEGFVMILDMDRVFTADELTAAAQATKAAA